MAIKNYSLIEFPIKESFSEMSEKEAEEFLKWFINAIPKRIEVLKKTLKETGYDSNRLDFSPESLLYIGEWFRKNITTRKLIKKEIERIQKKIPERLREDVEVPKEALSAETYSLCYDIGMYLAKVFEKNVSGLKWDFIRKPKNHIYYHQPVLLGGKIPLNPVDIVTTVATGILNNTYSSKRLFEIYNFWIKKEFTKKESKK